MRANKIDRGFLLGLYLFLNQMQLSLHRAKWGDFLDYAKGQFLFKDVIDKLNLHFACSERVLDNLEVPEVGFFRKLIVKKNYLYEVEQNYIASCVMQLAESLESSDEPDRDFILKLRLKLAYAAGIIQPRISEYKEDYSLVDHYNQNEILKTKSLEELLGVSWPN